MFLTNLHSIFNSYNREKVGRYDPLKELEYIDERYDYTLAEETKDLFAKAGCDNELTERCRKLGKYAWAPDAKVVNETQFDAVHKIAYDNDRLKHDRELLEMRSKLLGFDLKKNFQRPVNAIN